MSRADDFVIAALKTLKRPDEEILQSKKAQAAKKAYTEAMSNAIAPALAAELHARGLKEARPTGDSEDGGRQGSERRMSGAIGAKKVDVTWATETSGLMLAISVKCIMWPDGSTGNYQKNMTNRRESLLFESVTLHRRFPYSVLGGLMFFHQDAENDGGDTRSCTFINAHRALKLFTGRSDPAGRDEQYERLYIGLVNDNPFNPSVRYFEAGKPNAPISLDKCLDDLLRTVVDRDPDLWALLGPNDEKEPGPEVSPLSIVRFSSVGNIVKRNSKPTKKSPAKSGKKDTPPTDLLGLEDNESGEVEGGADADTDDES